MQLQACYTIAGIFRGYKLSWNDRQKNFRGFNFRGIAASLHACDIKFVGINVRGTCLINENREHLYPQNIPAIRYITDL